MQAILDNIIVKRDEEKTTSAGGIILQEVDKPTKGIVRSVGSKVTELGVGDVVVFSKFSGNEISIGGEGLLLMKEKDVFCTL